MIADLLMKLTYALTPKDQALWSEAMRGEYAAESRGRLGWAAGCLMVASGWRLKADGLWLAIIFAVPFFGFDIWSHWWWQNVILPVIPSGSKPVIIGPDDINRMAFFFQSGLKYMLYALAIGMWRPRLLRVAVPLMTMICLAQVYWALAHYNWVIEGQPVTFVYLHWMNLPPVIGELAFMMLLAVSAGGGALIRRAADRKQAK
ncbi:hypothetical protein [Asticcacaulis sp. YBE204]|uniref:hypothetical protein n=1 Tax=Asticcacaulis sp. YBE204 TaxID=1282363 RepID=UPI0003C3F911|nr:hypothetical protein [Asticcacaulis sp. YBE204]ESQ81282.1 hypothetical protein AEYBE204_02785 [Asticcacaulis sp. YBE204]